MNIKIDFKEASTLRGAAWVVGGVICFLFLAFSSQEKALAALSITATIAGGIGVILKDKTDEK